MSDIQIVIFSKDRAAQLDLLLESMRRFLGGLERTQVHVLYLTSHPDHEVGYQKCLHHHQWCKFIKEREFRKDVLDILLVDVPLTMFLVDDDVLIYGCSLDDPRIRSLHLDDEILCVSLRLAPSIDHCYVKDLTTPAPTMLPGLRFSWIDQLGDWGYPMSLDGHIFRTSDVLPLMHGAVFTNPNTLETILAASNPCRPLMACVPRQIVVNVPANRVQDYPSRNMGESTDWLNMQYCGGNRLNLDAVIAAAHGRAVHQEISLQFSGNTAVETAPRFKTHHVPMTLTDHLSRGKRRLHLGCGTRYLEGWINIDLPTDETKMPHLRSPDVECDLLQLDAPSDSIEEIYSSHVFEHFQRHVAIGLLCRWRRWLVLDGSIRLEMPDVEACIFEMTEAPLWRRLQLVRHLWGSHEAPWATHHEGWMPEAAENVLRACGFHVIDVSRAVGRWPSFTITGRKARNPELDHIMECLAPMYADNQDLRNYWLHYIRGELQF
jgi:hypothetical protein